MRSKQPKGEKPELTQVHPGPFDRNLRSGSIEIAPWKAAKGKRRLLRRRRKGKLHPRLKPIAALKRSHD